MTRLELRNAEVNGRRVVPSRRALRSLARVLPLSSLGRLWLLGCLASMLVGCAGLRPIAFRQERLPKSPLKADSSLEQVVGYINHNAEQIDALRAPDVSIRANGLPLLSANLAAAKGQRLRLVVSSVIGNEVDLGSNDEVVWFWSKREQPHNLYYVSHEQLEQAREQMQIPFEPGWLLEALGLEPIDSTGLSLKRNPDGRHVELVSNHRLAGGQTFQKVAVVDVLIGQTVEHRLSDELGRPLAKAKLSDFRRVPKSDIVIANRVELDWPMTKMRLTLNLGRVEVNPSSIPKQIWELPQMQNCQLVNLGDNFPPVAGGGRPSVAARKTHDVSPSESGTTAPRVSKSAIARAGNEELDQRPSSSGGARARLDRDGASTARPQPGRRDPIDDAEPADDDDQEEAPPITQPLRKKRPLPQIESAVGDEWLDSH